MPLLYEGRQHRRFGRESLDCAMALQELNGMGVDNIITFDAHDARVQNAIPLDGFENIHPNYQMIKALINTVDDLRLDREHALIVAPDEGGMSRCIYYSAVLGLDLGMFYKQRDYTRVVDGRNPILRHEFLGDDNNIEGRDVIIVEDCISTGESLLDICEQLKMKGARRVFSFVSFGWFCSGLEAFDAAYERGVIERVFTTNLVYRTPELKARKWYTEVNMCKYLAYIIDTLNHERSIGALIDPSDKIHRLLSEHGFDSWRQAAGDGQAALDGQMTMESA